MRLSMGHASIIRNCLARIEGIGCRGWREHDLKRLGLIMKGYRDRLTLLCMQSSVSTPAGSILT